MSAEEPYEIYARGYKAGHKAGLEEAMSRDAAAKVRAWKEPPAPDPKMTVLEYYRWLRDECPTP